MSLANNRGYNSVTGDRNQYFPDGTNVFVRSLNTAEITAYDPLLAPIVVEGGMDFNLTGGIEGLTAIETDAIYSRTGEVMELSGNEIFVKGDLYIQNDFDVSGNLTVLGATNCEGGANISGGNLSIESSSQIVFGTSNSVRVGPQAGTTNQGNGSVAIGYEAGQTNQGVRSVAIGPQAGQSGQHANTIVLNAQAASGIATGGIGRTYVAPIRGVAAGKGVGILYYDPTSKEVLYSTT